MGTGRFDSDVVVVGGGPGGCAAAITCATMGLHVRLLERQKFPRNLPGETLHPGVEPVLAQLGVGGDRLDAVVGSRHNGIRIEWAGANRFESYGGNDQGPWHGFQVWRADFDALLLARAREVGVQVSQPCTAVKVLRQGVRVTGVETSTGVITARTILDASGRSRALSDGLGIDFGRHSPPLVARYGYVEGECAALDLVPWLSGDSSGWLWTARVRPRLYQWTRVALDGSKLRRNWIPDMLRHLSPCDTPRGADVTWSLARTVARPGWFLVGDAAALLDPTAANGVLRALLSGITAGKLACGVQRGLMHADEAAACYHDWFCGWFHSAAERLSLFYRDLGVSGFGIMPQLLSRG